MVFVLFGGNVAATPAVWHDNHALKGKGCSFSISNGVKS
jgi:hypothetical protein